MSTPHSQTLSQTTKFVAVFRPSHWRYLALRTLVMFAAYQFALALILTLSPELLGSSYSPLLGLVSSLSFLAVFTISLYFNSRSIVDDLSIHLAAGMIEGPTGKSRQRIRIPLEKVDRARTRQVSWINLVFQYRQIWSLEGEKIMIFIHAFPPAQVQSLFQQIGCE